MATVVQETAPQQAHSKKSKSGAPMAKKRSKKSQPGRYSQLVIDTIRRLGKRSGSSLARVYHEAKKVPWFDQQNGRTYLRYSIKALVQNDTLLQVKGTGANGSFKLTRGGPEGGKEKREGAAKSAGTPAPKKSHKGAKKSHKGAKPPSSLQKKGAKPARSTPKKSHHKGASLAAKKVKKVAKPRVGKA